MAAFFGRWRGVGTARWANMPRLSRKPGSSWQAWRFWDSCRIKSNLHPRKLTWQWKIYHLKMYFLLNMWIFQGNVSFQGCSFCDTSLLFSFFVGCFLGTAIRIIVGTLESSVLYTASETWSSPSLWGMHLHKKLGDQTAHLAHSWCFVGELAETRKVGKAETIFCQFKERDAFSKLLWLKGIERICVGTLNFLKRCVFCLWLFCEICRLLNVENNVIRMQ